MFQKTIHIIKPLFVSPSSIHIALTDDAKGFNIPIYQRLYSWTKKEVTKLLEDLEYSSRNTPRNDYYIGNLTLNYNGSSKCFDIIDGQQRITTLWLIGLVFKNINVKTDWSEFLIQNGDVILKFIAREDDNEFLKQVLHQENLEELETYMKEKTNPMMVEAIDCISKYFHRFEERSQLESYSEYVYNKAKLVVIYLPDSIDLNKYFEDMNNRGLQLEGHHILKAKFLSAISKIDTNLQLSYSKVWDAISQMNQYVEYGLEGTLKDIRRDIVEEKSFFKPSSENVSITKSLQSLILQAINHEITKEKDENDLEKQLNNKVLSIISFPEFLLHCLRLYTPQDDISMNDKKLVETFEKHSERINVPDFIQLMFKTRINFDRFLIKGIDTNDGLRWEIKDITKNDHNLDYDRKKRPNANLLLLQLQGMLNASTSTNLWLTNVLEFVNDCDDFSDDEFLHELERIDLRVRSHQLPLYKDLSKGVQTDRYWFYKIDYLLWKLWTSDKASIPDIIGMDNIRSKIENFQFRDNRSVEHIQPNYPEIETWQSTEKDSLADIKNKIGNLALISIRSNSGYNNQSPSNKRLDFIKKSKNWGIESLKLASIYSYTDWTVSNMEIHQKMIVGLLCKEYGKNYEDFVFEELEESTLLAEQAINFKQISDILMLD